MASSSRKKTTMAKLNREAAVREKRQRKKMRKVARKQAAIDGPPSLDGETAGLDGDTVGLDGDTVGLAGDTVGQNGNTVGPDGQTAETLDEHDPEQDVAAISTPSPLAPEQQS